MYLMYDELERTLPHPARCDTTSRSSSSDAIFNADGDLLFDDNDESGFYGDVDHWSTACRGR